VAWVYFVGGAPPNNTHISSILTIATFMLAPVHRLGCRAGRLAAKCTQESSRPSWLRLVYRVLGVAESHDRLHKVARVVRRRKLCPLWQLLVGGAGAEAGAGAGAGAGAHREHRAAVCGVSSSSRPSPGVAAARGGAHANDRQIAIVPIQNRDAATCRWGGAERHPRLPHGAGRHF